MNPHLTNKGSMFYPGTYFEERREWCDGRLDDDNDFPYGFDDIPNDDNLDGGEGPDICPSEPDPEVNCERSWASEEIIY